MEHKFSKGDRVLITLKNGISYEGNVKTYSENFQRLSLQDIIEHPRNSVLNGCRHFECSEISRMEVMTLPNFPESNSNDETSSDAHSQDESVILRKISDSKYNKIMDLQNSFYFFDTVKNELNSVFSELQKSDIIGVHAKDTSRGRSGRASVIALSTISSIFIFDLEVLGDRIFDKGLREILQSESIKKVVYDCRLLSDCLFHKHQVKLVNVRDVEAEDVMVVHQERGCIRKHNRPFAYLIETYLGITTKALIEIDSTVSWKVRPLSPAKINQLAVFTSFLIPLHEAIEEHFLQRLISASKIYNEYLRDSDMYVYVNENCGYVFRTPLIELVKHKNNCRGFKKYLT